MPPDLVRHKLRRRREDLPLSRHGLLDGLTGADLLEVDLQRTAEGEWVCLHDDRLEHETTGRGRVRDTPRAAIAATRLRRADGAASPETPLFLDELVAVLLRRPQPRARALQLDLKAGAEMLDARAIGRLRALIGPHADRFLLSATDWGAARRVTDALPGLAAGFDPLGLYGRTLPTGRAGLQRLLQRMFEIAPTASVYYLEWRLLLAAAEAGLDPCGEAHRRGAAVTAWTVDADLPEVADVLARLLRHGVDRITTNDRDRLAPLLADLCRLSGAPDQSGIGIARSRLGTS